MPTNLKDRSIHGLYGPKVNKTLEIFDWFACHF